jgi:hypothetical protein
VTTIERQELYSPEERAQRRKKVRLIGIRKVLNILNERIRNIESYIIIRK